MAAGPGSETEHGSVQAYYMPHPVVGTLPSVMKLDPADWMGTLGAAMREANTQIAASPLNPRVKADMQAQIHQAHLTALSDKYYEDHPDEIPYFVSTGPQGPETVAKARLGVGYVPSKYMGGSGKPDESTKTDDTTNGDGDGKTKTTTTTNGDGKPKVAPAPQVPSGPGDYTRRGYGEGDKPGASGSGYDNTIYDSTSSIPGATRSQDSTPAKQVGSAAPPPAPGGDQLAAMDARISNVENAVLHNSSNPYQYLNDPGVQAQDQALYGNKGGMVPRRYQEGGQVQQPPPAPIAAGSGTTEMPTPPPIAAGSGTTTMPPPAPIDQEALRKWQGSTESGLHPVIPAAEVQKYLKSNWDTRVDHVTYNPGNGPGAVPTYTAGLKGGGSTTIPLPQLAKVAPHLVTGNNMSFTLAGADQGANAGANAAPPAPGQGQQQPGGVWSPFGGQQPFPSADEQANNEIRARVAQQISNPANLTAEVPSTHGSPPQHNATDEQSADNQGNQYYTVNNGQVVPKEGWKNLPADPNNNEARQVATTKAKDGTDLNWLVDERSIPGQGNLTGLKYYVLGNTGYSQSRMYAGMNAPTEVYLPDGQQIKNINDKLGINTGYDSNGKPMINPDTGKPYTQADRVDMLQDYLNRTLNKDMTPETQAKLESFRGIITYTQQAQKAMHEMGDDPSKWSWGRQLLNQGRNIIRPTADWLGGQTGKIPGIGGGVEGGIKGAEHFFGPVDQRLQDLNMAMTGLKGAVVNANLTPQEKGAIAALDSGNQSFPKDLGAIQDHARTLYGRYISQAMTNNEKMDKVYMLDAKQIRHGLPLPEDPHNPNQAPAAPAPTPRNTPVPTAQTPTASPTPIDVRNMNEAQWRNALRGVKVGTPIRDVNGVGPLLRPVQ